MINSGECNVLSLKKANILVEAVLLLAEKLLTSNWRAIGS